MATQILITDAGRAALVAPGNGGTSAHQVVAIGLANAPFVADKGLTKLPNELKRITTFGGANIAPDTVHATLKDDTADQYSLYGFGLYLENGVLLATYGQATPIMEKSPAALLLLSTDLQFASIDATQLVFGDASFLNPPATTERQGVVELATQAEVDGGADDTRAVTPKTAATRYAALTGAKFTGPVVTEFDAGPETAHVTIRPPSGKNGRESRVRLFGTFSGDVADTGTRLVATMRAGFDNGAWGREYVDVWVNKASGNDAITDANQARAVRITCGGRVLVGDTMDDGAAGLQVSGGGRFTGSLDAGGFDAGGAQIRLRGTQDAMLRNDGTDLYLLLSNATGRDAAWNAARPLTVHLGTGFVTLDASGSGAAFGGNVAVNGTSVSVNRDGDEGRLLVGKNDGYFYANPNGAGWWSPTKGAWSYDFAQRNLLVATYPVWHTGNLPRPAQTTGATFTGDVWVSRGASNSYFILNGNAETYRAMNWLTAGVSRWEMGVDNGGESGGNAGSNWYLSRRGDDGAWIDNPLWISRQSGVVNFAKRPAFAGATPWDSANLNPAQFVADAMLTAQIGQIVFEPRTTVRAGFLKANGALLKRADYPALWAYAQASGALSTEADWAAGWFGTFSIGDGATTFRIPELRGDFIRCWDDGRGVDSNRGLGQWQGFVNAWHNHGASAAESGDHNHSAWTDAQGWHGHHGWTGGVGDHQHVSPWGENPSYRPPWGTWGAPNNVGSSSTDNDNVWGLTSPAGNHNHEFNTEGAGSHGHNVGIGGAGTHSHAITVNADGGNEARPRNIALLAMIRAY
ncbi:phage tail protein [Burkholderia sp. F1]|uniref:phage tail protein n=1 Tax=Burkholderia sp. F1 TaxID=3366817 RepID=UPI003D7433EB